MSSEDASNLTLGMVECKTDPECFGFKYIPAEVINKNAVSVRSCQVDAVLQVETLEDNVWDVVEPVFCEVVT